MGFQEPLPRSVGALLVTAEQAAPPLQHAAAGRESPRRRRSADWHKGIESSSAGGTAAAAAAAAAAATADSNLDQLQLWLQRRRRRQGKRPEERARVECGAEHASEDAALRRGASLRLRRRRGGRGCEVLRGRRRVQLQLLLWL